MILYDQCNMETVQFPTNRKTNHIKTFMAIDNIYDRMKISFTIGKKTWFDKLKILKCNVT